MAKKYRPNVAAVVLHSKYPDECKVFLGKRNDMDNVWQFPQGGIDKGESEEEALFRELEEEIGTNLVEVLTYYPEWITYDFPNRVSKKMYPYDGQTQRYFLVKLKNDAVINLETKVPEFDDHKFVSLDEAIKKTSYFKSKVYKKVITYFQEEGYL